MYTEAYGQLDINVGYKWTENLTLQAEVINANDGVQRLHGRAREQVLYVTPDGAPVHDWRALQVLTKGGPAGKRRASSVSLCRKAAGRQRLFRFGGSAGPNLDNGCKVCSVSETVKQIVILGGGSAGWLTAAVIAAEHVATSARGLQVTVLESPDITPIGVGEGTWPTMRDTLREVGVTETDLMRECDASFKQGSRFDGWVDGRDGRSLLSPFRAAAGLHRDQPGRRLAGSATPTCPLPTGEPSARTCATRALAPKQVGTPEFAAVANYGYHFDAGKFGLFLRQALHGAARRAARARPRRRRQFARQRRHRLAADTQAHGAHDRRPVHRLLGHAVAAAGPALRRRALRLQKHVLFNDTRAGAAGALRRRPNSPIASQTIATAQPQGWIWDIGLPTRRGVGHVYSSAHTTDDGGRSARCERYIAAHAAARPRHWRCAAQAPLQARLPRASSGTATASPSACRPASSSRWRPRRWRWWSCRPR